MTAPASAGDAPVAVAPAPVSNRLLSLDALRGFDMLWIVGADAVGGAFEHLRGGAVTRFLAHEFGHSDWEGFTFYDLIFPLFVFMVGVAITFSLDRLVEQSGRSAALRRILRRSLVMYLLGLLFYGGMAHGYAQIRLLGVLQRLALCYAITSVLYLYLRPRAILSIGVALLVGYWALLTFVPVPGFGAGDYAHGHNLANWIDRRYLPLKLWYGDYDPEGLLSTLPAIASCILGVAAGWIVRDPKRTPLAKVGWLVAVGLLLCLLGERWGLHFPIVKKIWTSSFVLVAGGWSFLLLALFYYTIDVRGWRRWATPFVWIGTNAITIYLISHLVDFGNLSARLFGGEVAEALNTVWPGLGGLVLAAAGIGFCVAICGFLYRRKIFLKL
jgi:predicted acyltransferase